MVTRKNVAPAVKVAAKPAAKPAAKLAAAKPALKKVIAAASNGAHKGVAAKKAPITGLSAGAAAAASLPPRDYTFGAPAPFVFSMGQDVMIAATGEEGVVRGRGEFFNAPHQYLLAYRTALGTYADVWIAEDLLRA